MRKRLLLSLTLPSLFACGGDPAVTPPNLDLAQLVIAGSDFASGALSTIGYSNLTVQKNLDTLDPQTVLRAFGSQVFALDQTHGVVRIYDAKLDYKQPVDAPTSKPPELAGAQANPHDIFVDTQRQLAYVTIYGSFGSTQVTGARALGVLDLKAPAAGLTRFVSLSVAASDTDNNPDASQLVGCGDSLYVVLQDLDRNKTYKPAGPGRLAKISLADAGAPVSYIQLAGENPTSLVIPAGCTEAYVGSSGDQLGATLAGRSGLEVVDLMTGTTRGLQIKDSDLGGNLSGLDRSSTGSVFANVSVKSGTTYNNTVYKLDLQTKAKTPVLGPISYVAGLRVLEQTLVVLSAGMAGAGQLKAGVYVGAATGAALPTTPLDVGLPPISVDLVYR